MHGHNAIQSCLSPHGDYFLLEVDAWGYGGVVSVWCIEVRMGVVGMGTGKELASGRNFC